MDKPQMELWFTEKQTPDHGITSKVIRTLHHEETKYQTVDVIETRQFGNMLLLDGMVMTTDKDEFVYHEMIAHVAMNTHPEPKDVLVIGGGDGGAIREVLKYPTVETATLVEIDERVIEVAKTYFPSIAGALDDPRVRIRIEDGIRYVEKAENAYDVILVDSTEPIGPAVGLPVSGGGPGAGRWARLSSSALTATMKLEPDIESAAISGRSSRPSDGSNTPAAIGSAIEL